MTHPRIRAAVATLAAVGLVVLVLPSTVLAHAALVSITPADNSVVPPPPQIFGTFAQNLDPAKSSFAVVNAGGTVVAEGGKVDSAKPRDMILTLPALAPGKYTVRWTTSSTEDGELDRGTTTFTVILPTPPPSVAPSITPVPSAAASPSTAPSASPTAAPSPSPTGGTDTTTSSTDALIPIVAVLVVLALLGLWLLRGRSRRAA